MTPNDIHLLTGAYVPDSLDDADREVFTRHLGECEGCAAEITELRETVVRLADDSWAAPPPRLRQNVLEQIRTTRQIPPVRPLPEPRRAPAPAWRRRAAYGLAAAILAVVAGGGAYLVQEQRVRQANEAQAETRRQAERVQSVMTAPDAAFKTGSVLGGGQVTVVLSPSKNAAVVLLADADQPGPDRAYEFWMIQDDKARPAVVLQPGKASGTQYIEGIGGTELLGLTVEPAGGSATPSPPILAKIPMT
jgi:anti-sigma factor RsiW